MKRTPRDPIGQKYTPESSNRGWLHRRVSNNIVQYLGSGHPADATEGRNEYPPKRIHFRKMPCERQWLDS